MTRTMYDSVTPKSIPRSAQMVAGYIDGNPSHVWSASDWALFPNAVKVRIARVPENNDGHVLDVEYNVKGGEWPPGRRMVDWVIRRRQHGMTPTVYCNLLNDWPRVREQFVSRGVKEPQYWVARYDNKQTIPIGAVAKQYANTPLLGFNADASVVADYWPGVDKENTVSLSDEYFEFIPVGQTEKIRVKCIDALANLYIERFYGSGTAPWTGVSGRELALTSGNDVEALADALVARGVSLTKEQLKEAWKEVLLNGLNN